ncbi:MAG TPA: hypothetical protein VJ350_08910 [Methanoregula sp.]|nr:hypothetical protein [Methanoregula sp.]
MSASGPAAPGMTAHVTFLIPVVSCLSLRLPGMIFVQGFNGSVQGWQAGTAIMFSRFTLENATLFHA